MPPLPRSREGNESPKSHCHEIAWREGGQVGGPKPENQSIAVPRGGILTSTLLLTIVSSLLHRPAAFVCKDTCASSEFPGIVSRKFISQLSFRAQREIHVPNGERNLRYLPEPALSLKTRFLALFRNDAGRRGRYDNLLTQRRIALP